MKEHNSNNLLGSARVQAQTKASHKAFETQKEHKSNNLSCYLSKPRRKKNGFTLEGGVLENK